MGKMNSWKLVEFVDKNGCPAQRKQTRQKEENALAPQLKINRPKYPVIRPAGYFLFFTS